MSLVMHIFLFFIYANLGWLMEVIVGWVYRKKIVNRGFLIGPYCPIYGFGGTIITLALSDYSNNPIVLFCVAIVICGLLEYLTSYIMEKIFKARWWDYSQKKFNINGRVCLETIIPFGLLGCFIIYVINPVSIGLVEQIPYNIQKIIAIILTSVFSVDFVVSYFVISKLRKTVKSVNKNAKYDSTEEITKKVKEEILESKNVFGKRLIDAFPKFSIDDVKQKIKEKTDQVKESVTKVKDEATEKIKESAIKVKETTIKVKDTATEKIKEGANKVKESTGIFADKKEDITEKAGDNSDKNNVKQ